jgi:CheY-specific phosphatase CheX
LAEPTSQALPGDAELLAALERAVDEVFSSMVFAFEALAEHRSPVATPEKIGVRASFDREAVVEFRGAISGQVVFRCTADGAHDIARGLLMLDDSTALAVEEVNDALKECANMVTGHVKTNVLDPLGKFDLSIPFMKDVGAQVPGPACGALVYRLQQGLVSVELWRRDVPLHS